MTESGMKALSRLVMVGAVAGLAGCGLGGTFAVDPFMDEEISGSDFNAYLAKEYQRRTGVERDVDMEWVHAGRLANKGYSALAGETPAPWDPSNWNVDPADMDELSAARSRLVSALGTDAPSKRPEWCAKAQVYYDGWLEQSHDNDWGKGFVGPVQPQYVAAEKAAFMEAMPKCEGLINPIDFTIYFGWDRYDLTNAAVNVIDEIAGFVEDLGETPNTAVEGHTDTSGSRAYNVGLSKKRAQTVQKALGDRGISASASWVGETQLAVPTADGVREPLNRRAIVTLSSN